MSKLYKRPGSPYWWYTHGTPPDRIKKSTKTSDHKVATLLQEKWDKEILLREQGISFPTVDINKPKHQYITEIEANKKDRWAKQVKSTLNVFVDRNPGITNKHLTAFFMQEVILEFRYLERMLALIVHGEWIAALEMKN